MRNNRLTDAEIKEIKRTSTRIGEPTEHEREPEIDIKSTNITQTTDYNEETEIHTNHCEDNAESLEELERRDLSHSQACNKTSQKHTESIFFTENKNSIQKAKEEIIRHINQTENIEMEEREELPKITTNKE